MTTHGTDVAGFNELVVTMAEADFFTGILPFLLSYILFFLVIKKIPIMPESKEKTKKYSALISIIFAFFVANFIVQNPMYAAFFTDFTGRIAIGLIGILGFLVFVAMVGWDPKDFQKVGFAVIVVLLTVMAFGISGGIEVFIPGEDLMFLGASAMDILNYTIESGLIWLIVIGAALYWVTSESDDDRPGLLAPFPTGNWVHKDDQNGD